MLCGVDLLLLAVRRILWHPRQLRGLGGGGRVRQRVPAGKELRRVVSVKLASSPGARRARSVHRHHHRGGGGRRGLARGVKVAVSVHIHRHVGRGRVLVDDVVCAVGPHLVQSTVLADKHAASNAADRRNTCGGGSRGCGSRSTRVRIKSCDGSCRGGCGGGDGGRAIIGGARNRADIR